MKPEALEHSQGIREETATKMAEVQGVAKRYRSALNGLTQQNKKLKAQLADERKREDPRLGDLEEEVRKQGEQIERLKQTLQECVDELIRWCALAQQHEQNMNELADDNLLREAEELVSHG